MLQVDFLELAKNCVFPHRTRVCKLNKTVDVSPVFHLSL